MIDPRHVRDGITDRCAMVNHLCNGLMCGCPCHDQDHARLRDQVRAEAAAPTPPDAPRLTGAELVRRLFGPAVLAGDLEAAADVADRLLGEHERQVREHVAQQLASINFPVAEGTYSQVLVAARAVNRALAEVQLIVRGGPAATAQLQYCVPGVVITAEHLFALDCFRQSRGLPPWIVSAPPGALPSVEDLNRAVTWWNDGGHRGR